MTATIVNRRPRPIAVAQLKQAANGRWPEILVAVGGIAADILDGRHHPCPKCGGTDRFRLLDPEAGALICNGCFSRDNGDGIAAVQWLTGTNFPTAIARIGEYLEIHANGHANGQSTDVFAAVCAQKHMPINAARAFAGHQVGSTVIFPAYGPDGEQCSTFRLWLEGGKATKGIFEKSKPAGLFFPHFGKSPRMPTAGDTVIIAHSIKDAVALHSLGYFAIGLPGCELSTKFVRVFRGAHVTMVPHRNKTEYERCERNCKRLLGVAASVKRADLPLAMNGDEGDDCRDLLAKKNGEELLRQAIEDAREFNLDGADHRNITNQDSNSSESTSIMHVAQRTELAAARRFVEMHRNDVRYCAPWNKWLVWDDTRWRIDDACLVDRLGKQTARHIWKEIIQELPNVERLGAAALTSFGKSIASANGIQHVLQIARSEVAILPGQLDTNPGLLNVANGTIDLSTGRIRDHRRDDFITKVAPVVHNPAVECPTWLKFLRDIMAGNEHLISYLRRLVGFSVTGHTTEHVLPFLHGTGSNGKSTLINWTAPLSDSKLS